MQKNLNLVYVKFIWNTSWKGGNVGARLAYLCVFWLDVSISSHAKKHRLQFWLDVCFLSNMKNIARSSDWLELICVWKITTKLFSEYISLCNYIMKKKNYRQKKQHPEDILQLRNRVSVFVFYFTYYLVYCTWKENESHATGTYFRPTSLCFWKDCSECLIWLFFYGKGT